jgi:anti-anti-sigma regulatory factor
MDLRAAKPLKENLTQLLHNNRSIVIDASSVTKMSTACAQVTAAFIFAARKISIPVKIAQASPIFAQAMTLLGLSTVLEEVRS